MYQAVPFTARRRIRKMVVRSFVMLMVAAACIICGCKQKPQPVERPQRTFSETIVRVLLVDNSKTFELAVGSDFNISDNNFSLSAVVKNNKVPLHVSYSNSMIAVNDLHFDCNLITIIPEQGSMFTLNGETFRGSLVVIRDRQSGVIDAVNHIGIEDYLAGVVGAEMPSYWESAALESQTIIARTYCLFISERFGKGRDWDLRRTQANQAYRGLDAENPRIWQAIDKTYGQVLTSQNNILPAYYSSICGGHTEPSENVFGGEVYPALSGVDCPWCVQTARQEYFAWPTFEISKSDVWLKLLNRYPSMAGLGNIFGGIEILSTSGYDDFSRITKIKLVSDTGAEEAIRGEDFRLALDSSGMKIKSSSFEIIDANDSLIFVNGRGFGHGVGLCQYGAQALARNGKKAYEILEFYYPGCEIKSLY